jgi:hypothetical protein
VKAEFSVTSDIDDQGGVEVAVAGTAVYLSRLDIALLYALAESDWGALPLVTLQEIIERRWRVAPASLATMAGNTQRLIQAGLLRPENARGEADPASVRQSETGQRLITWLTRQWPDWPRYSQSFHLNHY